MVLAAQPRLAGGSFGLQGKTGCGKSRQITSNMLIHRFFILLILLNSFHLLCSCKLNYTSTSCPIYSAFIFIVIVNPHIYFIHIF